MVDANGQQQCDAEWPSSVTPTDVDCAGTIDETQSASPSLRSHMALSMPAAPLLPSVAQHSAHHKNFRMIFNEMKQRQEKTTQYEISEYCDNKDDEGFRSSISIRPMHADDTHMVQGDVCKSKTDARESVAQIVCQLYFRDAARHLLQPTASVPVAHGGEVATQSCSKNSRQLINDLMTQGIDFDIRPEEGGAGFGFSVSFTKGNELYTVTGERKPSKSAARESACERALKEFVGPARGAGGSAPAPLCADVDFLLQRFPDSNRDAISAVLGAVGGVEEAAKLLSEDGAAARGIAPNTEVAGGAAPPPAPPARPAG
eukprot:gene16952-biopygen356